MLGLMIVILCLLILGEDVYKIYGMTNKHITEHIERGKKQDV